MINYIDFNEEDICIVRCFTMYKNKDENKYGMVIFIKADTGVEDDEMFIARGLSGVYNFRLSRYYDSYYRLHSKDTLVKVVRTKKYKAVIVERYGNRATWNCRRIKTYTSAEKAIEGTMKSVLSNLKIYASKVFKNIDEEINFYKYLWRSRINDKFSITILKTLPDSMHGIGQSLVYKMFMQLVSEAIDNEKTVIDTRRIFGKLYEFITLYDDMKVSDFARFGISIMRTKATPWFTIPYSAKRSAIRIEYEKYIESKNK